MTTTAIREKLYNYVKTVDDEKIRAVYELFEDQLAPAVDWSQDEAFVAELDERVRRWEAGIDKGHTWEETEAAIEKLKSERASEWIILYCNYQRHRLREQIDRIKKARYKYASITLIS